MRARFSPYAQPQAAMTTAADAPNGTERINAISTVGMEISASATTTDVDASAPERDTMAATNSSPIAAATTTVSTAIMRSVREPAISQLSTSAPVPSVPNGCAADGEAHALKPLVSSSEYGVQTKDTAAVSSHSPMTIVAYLPLALAQMDETTAPVVLIVASAGVVDADSSPSVAFGVCVGFNLLMRSPSRNDAGGLQPWIQRAMRHIDHESQQQEECGQ